MEKIKLLFLVGMLYGLCGCSYRSVEYPHAIPCGYYNGYYNRNAVILYKMPSSKFGCWQSPGGWDCVRR